MKWEFTKNCRYKQRIVLLTYTLLTLIPAKCKSQVKITLRRQTIGRELLNLLISEKSQSDSFYNGGGEGKWELRLFMTSPVSYQRRKTRFGGNRTVPRDCCLVLSSFTVAHNCHGKTKNLTAKTKYLTAKPKTSRQKQNTSRQNRKPHRKTENLTAKPKTSRQNQIPNLVSRAFPLKNGWDPFFKGKALETRLPNTVR